MNEYGSCELHGSHCITCGDEAQAAMVIAVDAQNGMALVEIEGMQSEVDITLIEAVEAGTRLLVHGGVAIGVAMEGD